MIDFNDIINNKETIEEYLTPDKIKEYGFTSYQVIKLIKETGKIEQYLDNPEKLIEMKLGSYEITELIKTTGNMEEYLLKGQTKEDKNLTFTILNVIKKQGKENVEEYLDDLDKLRNLGITSSEDITKLIMETERPERYITKEKRETYKLSDSILIDIIRKTGTIEEYVTPEKIKEYGFDNYQVVKLIEETGKIEQYITQKIIQVANLSSIQVVELIKETKDVERYITQEIIQVANLSSFQVANLIKETGKIEQYLDNPEKLIEMKLGSYEITELIKTTGNMEEYLLKGQTKEDKNLTFTILNVIKKQGKENVEEYLDDLDKLRNLGITSSEDITKLIMETERPERYITKEKRETYKLSDSILIDIIRKTGTIEEYVTPEKIKEYGFDNYQVVKLIEETGKIEQYITQKIIQVANLSSIQVVELIKETKDIERYITQEIIQVANLSSFQVANLIKETGKIEQYLDNPEKLIEMKLGSYEITELIKTTGNMEEYLLKGQTKEDKNLTFTILNVIKKQGKENVEEYLDDLDKLRNLGITSSEDITKLIMETERPERYITKEKRETYKLSDSILIDIIRKTGTIEEYVTPEKIKEYGFDNYQVVKLIEETGKIEQYITQKIIQVANLSSIQVVELIKETKDVERYITQEIIQVANLSSFQVANLIKETGKIEQYLDNPEKLIEMKLGSYEITELIKTTGNMEEYLLKGQTKEDKNLTFTILNVIKKQGKENVEEYLDDLDKLRNLGITSSEDITKLIMETERPERYITKEKRETYKLSDSILIDIIRKTGTIEEYVTPEKIKEYGFDNYQVVKLIEETGKIEQYITQKIIQVANLSSIQVVELIKETKDIERYITQEIIQVANLSSFQVANLIKETGKIEQYLDNPEKLIEMKLGSYEITELIKTTGNMEEYLLKGQTKEDKNLTFTILNVIKKQGKENVEEYLDDLDKLRNLGITSSEDITKLIMETERPERYITKEKRETYKLSDSILIDIIRKTGTIEEYVTPEKIKEYGFDNYQVVKLIEETGKIEQYITQKIIQVANLSSIQVVELIKETKDVERYITQEIIQVANLSSFQVANLIKETGKIEQYLDNPEKLIEMKLGSYEITELIKTTENMEEYLLKGQTKEDKNLTFTILNVIKKQGKEKVEEYLGDLDKLRNLEITSSEDITKLIMETEKPEKYLFEGQDIENPNLYLNFSNLIKGLGAEKIEEYLSPEKLYEYGILNNRDIANLIKATGDIEKYLFENQNKDDKYLELDISNVIKGLNTCPKLTQEDVKLLCNFNDIEIIQAIINMEADKQKDAIFILDSLSRSNSAELRRIKVPIALQILDRDPAEYKKTLNEIEEIYLTNNIPTVGKLYLVFQKLHPNFLGEENSTRKDESSANIPFLQLANEKERKHIIFSDLLRCALESNSRNIRDYLETIEQGNILYEQLNSGKLEELDVNDKRRETLSKYRDILNTLYNVTSRGKRNSNTRENSGDLSKDLNELYTLFNNGAIHMNLPDRIVRTFGYGTGITTFEQAKSVIENSRKNAHEKNVKIAENGKIDLEQGDFIKGVADTQYFSSMLQKGILAKDFLGGNATHDCTPLDTDVEKIVEKASSFSETLENLNVAKGFTNSSVDGKRLGTIMLVFSSDNFIETRDSSHHINQEGIELLKQDKSKKEVVCNGGSTYGIRTGIGSTNIKCIISDRYVDKVGLEIAKNGFYIPVVDKDGNVIFTEKMYNDFRDKMQGLSYYGEDKFVVDETAKNEGTKQIAELIDRSEQNSENKRNKIIRMLEEATKEIGYTLSKERKTDLIPGIVEFIDTGSTGRGTNEPGDGDFDFMVRMDKILSDEPTEFKNALRKVLSKIKQPNERTETGNGDFRYKGVAIEGLDKEVDIDLSFSERTDEIEYSTDECVKDRLKTIKNQSPEDYRYVVANILLAKKFLKQSGVYKKSNAEPPKEGQIDTRGGIGAIGIENWVLQHGGSFEKAAESFMNIAKESKGFDDFKSNYSIWDFGENHISTRKNIYPHDNFIYNMNASGYEKMKVALSNYMEEVKKEKPKKVGIANIVEQDMSVIEDTLYMQSVRGLMNKQKELEENEK